MPTSKKKRAVAVAAYSILQRTMQKSKHTDKRKHRFWVRDWILKREEYGAYHTLLNELRLKDPSQLRNFLRMSATDFEELLNLVGPKICKQDTPMRAAIPAKERLAVTLRYLATGDSYTSLMYLFRIPQVTIARIVPEVCQAIYVVLKDEFMNCPTESDHWIDHARQFEEKWNFPNCIGALDGKHITMQAPASSGSYYYNYKGFHSIVLMAMVDANYKFTYVDVGCNGRISDGGVFANCSLSVAIQSDSLHLPPPRPLPGRTMKTPFVIVADDAFPLSLHIMKPFPFRNQPGAVRVFNYRLSRARRIVENAFGLLANVFRVFRKPLLVGPERTEAIVLAACALHNFLLTKKESRNIYAPAGIFDEQDSNTGVSTSGTWRIEGMPANNLMDAERFGSNFHSKDAKEIREEFKQFFVTPQGEIPWQYKYIWAFLH